MGMGTVEPVGGKDAISFVHGAIKKYQGKGVDEELLNYIKRMVDSAWSINNNNCEVSEFLNLLTEAEMELYSGIDSDGCKRLPNGISVNIISPIVDKLIVFAIRKINDVKKEMRMENGS